MLRATQDLAAGQCSVRVSLTHIIIIEYWASYQIDVETHSLSCPVLSCPVLSCPDLSCPVLSCPVLSFPVLSFPFLSFPFLSFPSS